MGGSDQPTMLAAYLPWFGQPGHINVGYSSQDRVVIEKQIDEAKQLGIAAFVVNWYGQHHTFEDKAYTLMQQAASEKQFKVAIMYDEDDSDPAGRDRHGPVGLEVCLRSLHRTAGNRAARRVSAVSRIGPSSYLSQGRQGRLGAHSAGGEHLGESAAADL